MFKYLFLFYLFVDLDHSVISYDTREKPFIFFLHIITVTTTVSAVLITACTAAVARSFQERR